MTTRNPGEGSLILDSGRRITSEQEAAAYLDGLGLFGIRPGLERVSALLAALGNPHLDLPVVHVGGTNGKGSTCTFLGTILRQAGYRIGTYTQPHLTSYRERMTINGLAIGPLQFAELIEEVRLRAQVLQGMEAGPPSAFEVGTAAMYLYFSRERVDLVIQEVGMGGRWDATNVVPAPLVSIITNAELDHTEYLGQTPEAIAAEKAGIIKPGIGVVTACQGPALDVVREVAARNGAQLMVAHEDSPNGEHPGSDISWTPGPVDLDGGRFDLQSRVTVYRGLRVGLLGRHQFANAALAVGAAELLAEMGFRVTRQDIEEGLKRTCWPGRLEVVRRSPILVVDGAHNPAGAAALGAALYEISGGRRFLFVFGVLSGKDFRGMLEVLAPHASRWIFTLPPAPRGVDPSVLAAAAAGLGLEWTVVPEPHEALETALTAAEDAPICIAGSLVLAGCLRSSLEEISRRQQLFPETR